MKRSLLALMFLMSGLISGCAGLSKELEYNEAGSKAMVYGYIDMKKAPFDIGWVDFKQVSPPSDKPIFGLRHDQGAVYNEVIPAPGSYQLSAMGGMGKGFLIFSSNTRY